MKPPIDWPAQDDLMALFRLIAADERTAVGQCLDRHPSLIHLALATGASRQDAKGYFFENIRHYVYVGDTALHVAAAGFRHQIAKDLMDRRADVTVRNRRGAQPLHYASDANVRNPEDQAATLACLLAAGADPNALDKSGVAPLHRAVRTRSAAAVEALLHGGADPQGRNRNGSTPLHLAVHTTGRGGSGEVEAQEDQARIIALLLQYGA